MKETGNDVTNQMTSENQWLDEMWKKELSRDKNAIKWMWITWQGWNENWNENPIKTDWGEENEKNMREDKWSQNEMTQITRNEDDQQRGSERSDCSSAVKETNKTTISWGRINTH